MEHTVYLMETITAYTKGYASTTELINACEVIYTKSRYLIDECSLVEVHWNLDHALHSLEVLFEKYPSNIDLYHCIQLIQPTVVELELLMETEL